MAISHVNEATVASAAGTTSTSLTGTIPTGVAFNDLLIFTVADGADPGTITGPSGWTLLRRTTDAGTLPAEAGLSIYWKAATGSDAAPVISCTAATRWLGTVTAYRGVDTTTPFITENAVAETTSTATHTAPTLTNTNANAWGLYALATRQVATPYNAVPGSGLTERVDQEIGNAGSTNTLTYLADSNGTVATGSVTYSATANGASTIAVMWAGLLNPSTTSAGSGTLALSGSGSLTAHGTPGVNAAATLSGSGTLSLSGSAGGSNVISRWVGAVTDTGATVAVKTSTATSVRLKVATNAALTAGVVFSSAVTPDANSMSKPAVTGLTANTLYYYALELNGALAGTIGQFRTFPTGAASFSFAFGSCTNDVDSDAFTRIKARNPLLFLNLGDIRYTNPGSNNQTIFRTQFDNVLSAPNESALYANCATAYTWSDHDFGGSNSDGTAAAKPAAQAVYRQYVPHYPLPDAASIYQTFVVGRVRFIVTDNRSNKTPDSATDDTSKTMLGATQKQWFKDTITAATEPVIVWASENLWTFPTTAGEDSWGGFDTERQELANYILASGKHVVVISGDTHQLAADSGANGAGSLPQLLAAPLANTTASKGGPWSAGSYKETGTNQGRYYGWVDVTDTGSSVLLSYSGTDNTDIARVKLTLAFNSASFSGAGSLTGVGVSHQGRRVFRGVLAQRRYPVAPPITALMNYSKAVLRINGQWVETEWPTEDQIEAADLYFPGGYENEIDDATAESLTAAGYTVE